MPRPLRTLATAALAASLALPLAAQDQTQAETDTTMPNIDPSTVVATVNGEEITLGHMIIALTVVPEEYRQLEDQVLYDGILNQLVQQEALAQNFTETLPPRVVYSLENERRALVAQEVIEAMMSVPLDEAEVQAVYDERFGNTDAEDEYNAAHILVETEEEALAVKEELDGGADFSRTAREKSIGPSGPSGGDLGWFSSGMMVPEFEAATIALEEGEISAPVQTQFGWHVIQLKEVRKANIPTLDETRPQIEFELRRNIANAAIEAAAATADVVITPAEDWDAGVIRRIDLFQ